MGALSLGRVVPDGLERPEPELLLGVEARVVDPPHVLVAVLGGEGVVRLGALPAVDDEVAARRLDVAEQLRADESGPLPEELRPLTPGAVRALEPLRLAHLVAGDESDHGPIVPLWSLS